MKYIILAIMLCSSTLQANYFGDIPKDIAEKLIKTAESKYPSNFDMQEYYIKNQTEAYKKILAIKKELAN